VCYHRLPYLWSACTVSKKAGYFKRLSDIRLKSALLCIVSIVDIGLNFSRLLPLPDLQTVWSCSEWRVWSEVPFGKLVVIRVARKSRYSFRKILNCGFLVDWKRGLFLWVWNGRGVKLTTNIYLVLRVRTNGPYLDSPICRHAVPLYNPTFITTCNNFFIGSR